MYLCVPADAALAPWPRRTLGLRASVLVIFGEFWNGGLTLLEGLLSEAEALAG